MAEHIPENGHMPEKGHDVHSSTSEPAAHGETPSLFKLDPGVGIWALIVFGILLLVLRRFAWNPILSSLYEREKNIRDSVDKAKQAQNESKRIANEQNEILKEAKSQASAIIQEAKITAESLSNKIRRDAMEEKNRIVESGIRSIESAKTSAMSSLKKDTASLAIQVAEKLLRESLDDEKHRKYVENAINDLTVTG